MKKSLIIFLLSFALLSFAMDSAAAVFAEGLKAYKKADYLKAKNLFEILAEQGEVKAQRYLALMYDKGYGGKKNYGKAIYWYRRAATQKDAKSQFHLGLKYANGHGVALDKKQAYSWFALAFSYGYKQAADSIKVLNKTMSVADRQEALLMAEQMQDTLQ